MRVIRPRNAGHPRPGRVGNAAMQPALSGTRRGMIDVCKRGEYTVTLLGATSTTTVTWSGSVSTERLSQRGPSRLTRSTSDRATRVESSAAANRSCARSSSTTSTWRWPSSS